MPHGGRDRRHRAAVVLHQTSALDDVPLDESVFWGPLADNAVHAESLTWFEHRSVDLARRNTDVGHAVGGVGKLLGEGGNLLGHAEVARLCSREVGLDAFQVK